MSELDEFFADLMRDAAASSAATGELTRTVLVEDMAKRLVDAEELQEWEPCFYEGRGHRRRLLGLDGWSTESLDTDGTLRLLVAEIRDGDTPAALATAEINAAFARAAAFVAEARDGRLHEELEPSTPAADLARLIHDLRDDLKSVRVHVLSNAILGPRYRAVDRDTIAGVKAELDIWDLARFQEVAAAGGREPIEIDLTEFVPDGLAALPAGLGETGYSAFLCVVPGALLATIYDRYGSRLLEGNVRAFLNTKGNVNKGIRRTLANEPEHFFAFNNGITATASDVRYVCDSGRHRLTSVTDLQVVNGGQTTASMYNSRERDKAKLDGVFVQMKLAVLPPHLASDMIPQISRFANTQNKVSDADLFANHPFHRKVEELSRRLWAPPAAGTHLATHWFYERARAQYQTGQFMLARQKQREFLAKNPKAQVITKTDLAKFEHSWRKLPHLVSAGAQKNFTPFANTIEAEFDRRPDEFNERWYQHMVAKAILFRATEREVSRADWYKGGYRANIVTYAIARFVKLVEDEFPQHVVDLDRIWKTQAVGPVATLQLLSTATAAHEVLIAPPTQWRNVTEWAKRPQCWEQVSRAAVPVVSGLSAELKAIDEERIERHGARVLDREDATIGALAQAIQLGAGGFWQRAAAWPRSRSLVSPVEFGVIGMAARIPNFVPTDAQAKRLVGAAAKLQAEGLR